MDGILNLANLFHRKPIPIGSADMAALEGIYRRADGSPRRFMHWLIALIWYEGRDISGWSVNVYPVEEGTAYWQVTPIFHTLFPSSFDNAWRLSEVLRAKSERDELTQQFVNPYWDEWEMVEGGWEG